MKTLNELLNELTSSETAELLTEYKPSRKVLYRQALQAATVEPTDKNIITVLLLKPNLMCKLVK